MSALALSGRAMSAPSIGGNRGPQRPAVARPQRRGALAHCIGQQASAPAAAAGRPLAAASQRRIQLARDCHCLGQARTETGAEAAAAAAATAAVAAAPAAPLPELPPLDADYEAAAAFAPFANWLVPGRLMVGRYPYVEPSRCASHDVGAAQLDAILRAGPHVFVSLQDEVPPQGEMRVGGVKGFLPYKATAELISAALTPPPPNEVVNGLRNPKLDEFLPKRRRTPAPEVAAYYQSEAVSFLRCPIVDLSVPTMQQLSGLTADLQRRLERGERLYVHCWGGRGRAGTVGACLLAAMYGLSADDALERVQRAFDTRQDNERRSPETDEQRRLVREFVAALDGPN